MKFFFKIFWLTVWMDQQFSVYAGRALEGVPAKFYNLQWLGSRVINCCWCGTLPQSQTPTTLPCVVLRLKSVFFITIK